MTSEEVQARILKNQVEIMWAISYLLSKSVPDLVGKGGEFDQMRQDLAQAAKSSGELLRGFGYD